MSHVDYETRETIYVGDFGEPWVAWLKEQADAGWEFRSASVVKRGRKDVAYVGFRREIKSLEAATGVKP